MASRADRYALYLDSVQEPSHEVAFFRRVYRAAFNAEPLILREDFCGTAAICYEWVKRRPACHAIGVDIDSQPLDWGRAHLAPKIGSAVERVTLLQQDVRAVSRLKADVLAAENFSYWTFKTRPELLQYFKAARANLGPRGVMVLDMMGGSEVIEQGRVDTQSHGRYTYVWDQHAFDPITHHCQFHIHFRFRDGSEINRAFTYNWRLWTVPEVRELLLEAGFDHVDVYWEDTGADGNGTDVYRVRSQGDPDPAWIAYITAVKRP